MSDNFLLTYHKNLQKKWRQMFDHVIHFSVELVGPEHVPVFLADLLNSFQGKLDIA